jgi:hypothetical protein
MASKCPPLGEYKCCHRQVTLVMMSMHEKIWKVNRQLPQIVNVPWGLGTNYYTGIILN